MPTGMLRGIVLAALLAFPGLVLALGLGQIVVRSAPGQPFLAEIPIVATNPAELRDLQVRLASPETFRRIGLDPPDAAMTALQFTVALDAQGNPVVRVTSAAPVSGPLLTFLIEADWGEGRLVREYSALVDAPDTLAAPVQSVQAPAVAPANTIPRPDAATIPVPEPEIAAEALPPAPVAVEPAPRPEPAPQPQSRPSAPPTAPTRAPDGDYRVQAGDTLSEIASGLDRRGSTLDQTMLALLRANPDAFIGGNINLVRQGAVLRMPPAGELSRYSAGEAAAMVRTQVAEWREARAARLQASEVARAAAAGPSAGAVAASGEDAAPAGREARLEIMPAVAGAGDAGTRTGTQAGGEGRMLRQEIQQTQETLAARDVELGELKARVAELEKIQDQQQQLIAMKDSALAAARENLAKASATQEAAQAPAASPVLWPWLLAGLAVALVAAWWFMRRRGARPRPRLFDSAEMAASVPSKVAPAKPAPAPVASAPAPASAPTPVAPASPAPPAPPATTKPPVPEAPPVPHWTAAPALVGTLPAEELSPARQVELARAYIDLGDNDAARDLLQQALAGRDPVAREIATRMLREIE